MNKTKNFKDIFLSKLEEIRDDPLKDWEDLTAWDIVLEVLKEKEDIYIITLKADLSILQKIAEGFSAHSIGLMLGIPTGDVLHVANIWGMFPLETTLDFSPMYVYEEGMKPSEMVININTVLPIPISEKVAEIAIHNIERYYELSEIVKEEERNE